MSRSSGSKEVDPAASKFDIDHETETYIQDMDRACAAATEMEHYFTTSFWPHALNKPWRKTPGNKGYNAPMIPPDLKGMSKQGFYTLS